MFQTLHKNFSNSSKFKLTLSLVTAVFTYGFLLFFQPFGVNNYKPDDHFSPELALGILPIVPVYFASVFFLESLLKPLLVSKLKIGFVTWYLIEFMLIGSMSFLLYNYLGGWHDLDLESYLLHIFEVSTMLIFPFSGVVLYFYFVYLKELKPVNQAETQSSRQNRILFQGTYKKDRIWLDTINLLFIESEDNYVALHYLENNEEKTHLIRTTLSSLENSIDSENIIRCHRSFLVNPKRLKSMIREDGKDYLTLEGTNSKIPVSRSFKDKIKEAFDR